MTTNRSKATGLRQALSTLQRLTSYQFTVAQFLTLVQIYELGECSQSELGHQEGLNPSTISRMIQVLGYEGRKEKDGRGTGHDLLEIRRGGDLRQKLVSLNPRGRSIMAAVLEYL